MNNGHGKRILLVDDDEALVRTIVDFLRHEGFDVVPARDGKQALARMDEATPDLLVLDISMPVMGGLEVLKRIQNPDGTRRCPVLVLTARAAMEGFFDGIAVDGFLAKPCAQEELVNLIRQILSAQDGESRCARCTKRTLLAGESDPQRAQQLQDAFTGAGYEFIVAGTGPEVLEKAIEELPDAILINEILPHMNGSEVASLVRVMPSTRSVPIVLYDQTRTVADDRKYAWRVPDGVVALVGPTDPGKLLQAVEKALGPWRISQ